MAADRFLTLDGRPTVRVEREYPHPIDKVWRAVTTPEHLGRWFPSPNLQRREACGLVPSTAGSRRAPCAPPGIEPTMVTPSARAFRFAEAY